MLLALESSRILTMPPTAGLRHDDSIHLSVREPSGIRNRSRSRGRERNETDNVASLQSENAPCHDSPVPQPGGITANHGDPDTILTPLSPAQLLDVRYNQERL